VGEDVGEKVGEKVGETVGDRVGITVGAKVGEVVGCCVGDCVGVTVGLKVGDAVGLSVGLNSRTTTLPAFSNTSVSFTDALGSPTRSSSPEGDRATGKSSGAVLVDSRYRIQQFVQRH